jgi:hypothetical protein
MKKPAHRRLFSSISRIAVLAKKHAKVRLFYVVCFQVFVNYFATCGLDRVASHPGLRQQGAALRAGFYSPG